MDTLHSDIAELRIRIETLEQIIVELCKRTGINTGPNPDPAQRTLIPRQQQQIVDAHRKYNTDQ
jgi:hypothetical protein